MEHAKEVTQPAGYQHVSLVQYAGEVTQISLLVVIMSPQSSMQEK